MRTLLTDCHVISPGRDLEHGAILIDGKTIQAVLTPGSPLPAADEAADLHGKMVMPGFIDVHCHGRNGDDFSEGGAAAATRISQAKLAEGVTTLLPTTLTLPQDTLLSVAAAMRECTCKGANGCKLAGLHLEGPYVNPEWLGAQNPAFVRPPNLEEVLKIHAVFPVKKITYAVEMPNGAEFTTQLRQAGITPSCGHSGASYEEFLAAFRNGLRDLTHFGNRMSQLHHREIGLVGAGLLHQELYLEVIGDRLHLAPAMLKLLFQTKGCSHLLLITDALRCTGMADGNYTFGGMPFTLNHGEARLPDGALAGSTLTMNQGLKNLHEVTGLPLASLVQCCAWNQAQSLQLPGLGRIEPGYVADLAVLNDDFTVISTWVDGRKRYPCA